MNRTLKNMFIAFGVLVIACSVADWISGIPLAWSFNLILSFYFVALVSLFGGILNIVHKR